jgi:acetyl esterase/lipase
MKNHFTTLASLIVLCMSFPLLAAPPDGKQEILLWPNGAPGLEKFTNAESVRIFEPTGDHVITDVHKPSVTVYLPAPGTATGAAVIVVPGGGHREIWIDHEGYNVARWLSIRWHWMPMATFGVGALMKSVNWA